MIVGGRVLTRRSGWGYLWIEMWIGEEIEVKVGKDLISVLEIHEVIHLNYHNL